VEDVVKLQEANTIKMNQGHMPRNHMLDINKQIVALPWPTRSSLMGRHTPSIDTKKFISIG
jgi:hypothetical protein